MQLSPMSHELVHDYCHSNATRERALNSREQARAMKSIQQSVPVTNTYHHTAVEAFLDQDRSPEWICRERQKQVWSKEGGCATSRWQNAQTVASFPFVPESQCRPVCGCTLWLQLADKLNLRMHFLLTAGRRKAAGRQVRTVHVSSIQTGLLRTS